MRNPDFFIVGAPKCGNTALYQYLDLHPSIYIFKSKEPRFFGSTLGEHIVAQNLQGYSFLFKPAGKCLAGDGSTSYLFTKNVETKIFDFNPHAKIVIMLRNLIDLLHAWHSELVYMGYENVHDLRQALQLKPERRLGKHIPKRCRNLRLLYYREIVKFSDHVRRYQNLFGKEKVYTIIFDEFKQNTSGVFKGVCEYLDIDSSFEVDFKPVNPNKIFVNKMLYRFLPGNLTKIRSISQKILPASIFKRVLDSYTQCKKVIADASTQTATRPALSSSLDKHLRNDFSKEVENFSLLLDRDLNLLEHSS